MVKHSDRSDFRKVLLSLSLRSQSLVGRSQRQTPRQVSHGICCREHERSAVNACTQVAFPSHGSRLEPREWVGFPPQLPRAIPHVIPDLIKLTSEINSPVRFHRPLCCVMNARRPVQLQTLSLCKWTLQSWLVSLTWKLRSFQKLPEDSFQSHWVQLAARKTVDVNN